MKTLKSLTACLGIALFAVCLTASISVAANYPSRPIKILVQANAGGAADIIARQLAPLLTEELGQSVVVVNQPGGNGNLAANTLVKGKHDGYTLAVLSDDALSLNFTTMNVSYKYEDLIPISNLGYTPFGFYAHSSSKWNNFDDVVKTAKEENRAIKVSVFSAKSREAITSLAKNAGIELTIVPSQSAPTVLTDVLGQHTELGVIGTAMADSIIAGKAKLIGSLSDKRFPNVPDVLTIEEQGYTYVPKDTFIGLLYAPKNTPKEVLVVLEAALQKVIPSEQYQTTLEKISFTTPEQIGMEAAAETVKKSYDEAMLLQQSAK